MEISKTKEENQTIFSLKQEKYSTQVIATFNMQNAKSKSTPISKEENVQQEDKNFP